jgi:hypothetical protein
MYAASTKSLFRLLGLQGSQRPLATTQGTFDGDPHKHTTLLTSKPLKPRPVSQI